MNIESWDIAIVGGGPAGLMAGARAAARGRRTLLLEKNRAPGAKILISGGGRCNLTHACDARGIIDQLGPQAKFLHSALAAFGPFEVVDFFRAEGVPTYVEPETGKVFPQSDRASDVLAVLLRKLKSAGCELAASEPLLELDREGDPAKNGFRLTTSQRILHAEKVLLATGGKSYPDCGTTGDGYRFAEKLGHAIVPPRPALVPLSTNIEAIRELQGITLPDVLARIIVGQVSNLSPVVGQVSNLSCPKLNPKRQVGNLSHMKCLGSRRGAVLFTHFGLSGPAAMDLSRFVSGYEKEPRLVFEIDLLPDLNESRLAEMIARECAENGKKTAVALLDHWTPHRVAREVFSQIGLDPRQRLAEFSKEDRSGLIHGIKHFCVPIAGTLGFRHAEVTAGGVALAEVDSRTMQSKKCPNLYFSGELLDLDGPIGGYNLQIAFSTGFLAGESM
jgi:predicted flavoprotein YhiN